MPGFISTTERLSVYTHLRTFESDFDRSQSQIRTICSAWSAAVLGAVGLITVNAFTPPVGVSELVRGEHLAYLRGLICIIGSAGVYAFWFIDQRVYQKLLHSTFAYGLFLELEHPDLPQIRSSMFIAHLDITSGLSWFYRMQFWIFLLIAAVFVLQPFGIDLGPVPRGIKSLTEAHFVGVVIGEWRSGKWSSLGTIIHELYPPLRNALPEPPPSLRQRIGAWLASFLPESLRSLGRRMRALWASFWRIFGIGQQPAPENMPRRRAWENRVASRPLPDPPPQPAAGTDTA